MVRPRTSLREAEGGRKVSSGQGSEDCKEGWWENIGLGLFFFSGRWSDPSDKWEYDGNKLSFNFSSESNELYLAIVCGSS